MCALCVIGLTLIDLPNLARAPGREVKTVKNRSSGRPAVRFARCRASASTPCSPSVARLGHDGPFALKPGQLVEAGSDLIVAERRRFVSRGGEKLENALGALGIEVAERDCLDVGASTGGFTDCLLQRGAARVAAVDVGHGELDWGLRNDDRVTVIEGLNARDLGHSDLPFPPSLATVDVSFISLRKVLPAVAASLDAEGEILALVKPQFELGRERVGKGGVVREGADRRDALVSVAAAAQSLGLAVRGFASSGLPGPKGNLETFVWCSPGGESLDDVEAAIREVEP
jgi:23S rRNA (cytidine1920-2'-O)/16S rRNA (cytidine1409-2'-O)-methyltransferase